MATDTENKNEKTEELNCPISASSGAEIEEKIIIDSKKENTQKIKNLLWVFINQLKGRERSVIRSGDLEPRRADFDVLKKGINLLVNTKAFFESIDDLNSIKRLREVESFFSKNTVLGDFAFPEYQSYIDPVFLIYADIEIQLDTLFIKADDLTNRGFNDAGDVVHKLIFNLKKLNRTYFQEKKIEKEEEYKEYKFIAINIIDGARPILEQHRGYKKILTNLVALILTLGIAFIVNKAVNGHFLFFQKTNSSEQLDKLDQSIFQLSL